MKIYVGIPIHNGIIEDITVSQHKDDVDIEKQAFNVEVFGMLAPTKGDIESRSGMGTEYLTFVKEIDIES